jgi:hypothetical protein
MLATRNLHNTKRTLLSIGLLCTLLQSVSAQEAESSNDKSIAELKRELGVRDQAIRNLIRRIEQLERAVTNLQKPNDSTEQAATESNAAQSAVQANNTVPAAAREVAQAQDIERIRAAFERTLIDRGGLTLPKGAWEIDAGVNYSHSSSEKLTISGFTVYPVLIVGDIVSERVRRDTFGTSVSGRIGLPWQTQLDVRVPYTYETSSRVSEDGNASSLSDHGIGDVEIGFSRPVWRSKGGSLDVLGALRWKAVTGRDPFDLGAEQIPFGNGFDALSVSFTAVSAQDPMVFFGSLIYTNNLPDNKGGAHINPGDGFGLALGTALAVNLDTSLSFSYQQQFTNNTRIDGAAVDGSYVNSGSLSISLSHALQSGKALDTALVIGLTEDSPDVQLTFSMPLKKSSR